MRSDRRLSLVASIVALLILLPAPSSVAWAEAKGAPEKSGAAAGAQTMSAQEQMDAYMEMAAPGEEHKRLAALAGTWKSTTTMYMNPSEPSVTVGTSTCEPILGGRYMLSKHVAEMEGMPFEGLEIMGYDRGKSEYFTVWFDNMGTGIMHLTGHATPDGKRMTYEGVVFDPMQGRDVKVREEVVYESDRRYFFTMYWETSRPDGTIEEKKVMELVGEKQ